MKNIDNDIEQFEKNLIEIDSMKTQISELKTSLDKIVKETEDIEKIKVGINSEIESMKKTSGDSIKLVDEKIKELEEIANDVKNSMGKDADKIIKPIETSISEVKAKQEVLEKKILISYVITIIGFVIITLILLIK